MEPKSNFAIWLAQFRANFLLLAVVLVLIGIALSVEFPLSVANTFNWVNVFLMLIGNILAHSSVNLFNDYFDYKSKIDFETPKTPFSGGSGMLIKGYTKPKQVLIASIITMIIALAIGIYFAITAHWFLYILIAVGAITIIIYTNILSHILLGEFFTGLTLGTFVVLGTYIGLSATPDMSLSDILKLEVILVSIPPGILTFLLLYLNEFPDAEADKKGGRYHLIILLGRKNAAILYTILLLATYGVIILTPLVSSASFYLYFALLTLPIAIKSSTTALKFYSEIDKIIPAMGMNILVVLITDLLLAIGVFVG